jgi:hypothetical protein
MNAQCNSCGGFNDINKCPTCFTLICARCQTNHEQGCSQAAEMKKRGQGPTVHEIRDTNLGMPLIPADAAVTQIQDETIVEVQDPAAVVDAVLDEPQSDLVYQAALATEAAVESGVTLSTAPLVEPGGWAPSTVFEPSSVVASDGQTEPKTTI